jgi:hypothetical protein
MKTTQRLMLATGAALLTLGAMARAQSRITKSFSLAPGGEFVLDSDQGSVTVSGFQSSGVRLTITSNREQINKLFGITNVVSPG